MKFKKASLFPALFVWTTGVLLYPTIASAECPGDFNLDNNVNGADLGAMLAAWGECAQPCLEDIDENGIVDGGDLGLLLAAWGECPDDPDQGTGPFNYGEALQKAVSFYLAQRSGNFPENYPLNWRGNSFDQEMEQENGQYPVDAAILNRYMDAGDTPTFVLPITSAMTMLSWGGIEFGDGLTDSGQMDELLDAIKWHADWVIAAHPEADVFCGQIGQGAESHAFWGPPEIHPEATSYRPKIWWLTPDNPGSEPTAEAAAFLAAASILFQDEDAAYASILQEHAEDLYDFANTYRENYISSIPHAANYYYSWSGYMDELAWSATWLYRATDDPSYLQDARSHYANAGTNPGWSQSWDGKINGTAILLAGLTGESQFINDAEQHLNYWLPGGGVAYTSGGLAWLDTWGSLRYSANTAFLAFAYSELVGDPNGDYRAFGEAQINYILGDNPRNSSYVCGFGENPPVLPHHAGAHGSWNNNIQDTGPNRHILWGALVGGPTSANDFDYVDVRDDYIANEVTCDYNAGMTAALAYLRREYGGDPLPDSQFPPVEDAYGKEFFVEAAITQEQNTSTSLRCYLNNRSAWPARMSDQLSFRIVLDLSEVFDAGYDADDVFLQANSLNGGTMSELQLADAGSSRYYVEISYEGVSIGPGGSTSFRRECQITIGINSSAPSSAWDPANDPSLIGLPSGWGNEMKSPGIPVYEAGVLVYGDE